MQYLSARERLWVAACASLALHVALAIALWLAPPLETPKPEDDRVRFSVLPRAGVPAPGAVPDRTVAGEVIDLPKPEVERIPPADARFLSQWNTRVEREQKVRARGGPKRPPRAEPPPAPPSPAGEAAPAQVARKAGDDRPGLGTKRPEGEGKAAPGEARDPTLRGMGGLDKLLLPTIDGTGRVAGRNLHALSGGYVTDDALLGVPEEGDTTLVNSRSFKYWDFFQRVKERVRGEWSPGHIYSARDPDGKVFGSRDRLTILTVALDAEGRVMRLDVSRESGLPFLDEEAIRAFRQAGPFTNPPAGLVDADGRIAFTFGFLLEMGASKGRFFWQRQE
jgi:TonB family protein